MMSIIEFLKEQDITLNHQDESFERKIACIINTWKTIVSIDLLHCELKSLVHVVDWAILHTLNLLLNAEWNRWHKTYELDLLNEVERARIMLVQRNFRFNSRCEKVAHVLESPWSNPVLMRIMRMENIEICQDVIDLFCFEETHLISVRLNKLCQSCCEDLALNLVKAYFKTYEIVENRKSTLNATQDQIFFIFDIRLVLLYKFKEYKELQNIIEDLDFQECLTVLKRLAHKREELLKIWKYSPKLAMFAIQTRIDKCVVNYDESGATGELKTLVKTFIDFCSHDKLEKNICRYLQDLSLCVDSSVIYKICETIHGKHESKLKSLTIELFIRGLTWDMNELEKEKLCNDSDNRAESTRRLATKFGMLATFLEDSVEVSRECFLTAFSLDPTKNFLDRIEDMARKSGFQVSEEEHLWRCKLHPPALPSDEITWKCPECQEWMSKPVSDVPLGTNVALDEAIKYTNLDLPESLCDDLIICLTNPRYHILSWSLPWNVLHRLCIMYFKDPNATKNFVTELKFLDIDYSIFQNIKQEPLDEYPGIEKGFEKYLSHDFSSVEKNIGPIDQDKREVLANNNTQFSSMYKEILKEHSKEYGTQKENHDIEKTVEVIDKTISEHKVIRVEPIKTLVVDIKRKKEKKYVAEDYPDNLKSLRKYLKPKKSKKEKLSTRRHKKSTDGEKSSVIENAVKFNSGSDDISTKLVQIERNHAKKHIKKEKQCNDENYDPNSLESLRKYLKSKQLKQEISSTRKYYKKSIEKAQYQSTKSDDGEKHMDSEKSEIERKKISEEEKTKVVDNVEKSIQNFIQGEEYDPNSIESLKKCVDLEKSKEKLLSNLRKHGLAAQNVKSNILHTTGNYEVKNDIFEEFENDCWSNFDEATRNRYEFLRKSRYFTLHHK